MNAAKAGSLAGFIAPHFAFGFASAHAGAPRTIKIVFSPLVVALRSSLSSWVMALAPQLRWPSTGSTSDQSSAFRRVQLVPVLASCASPPSVLIGRISTPSTPFGGDDVCESPRALADAGEANANASAISRPANFLLIKCISQNSSCIRALTTWRVTYLANCFKICALPERGIRKP